MVSSLVQLLSLQSTLLQNFNGITESKVLIMKVQRLKDIFSIACMNVHAYLNIPMHEQNDATQDNVSCGITVYKVSQEECAILRESVPYVELYRYNPKHLYPKLNGYGDNGQRSVKL